MQGVRSPVAVAVCVIWGVPCCSSETLVCANNARNSLISSGVTTSEAGRVQAEGLWFLLGYNSKELQRVLDIIMEHLDLLREAWNEHFTQ